MDNSFKRNIEAERVISGCHKAFEDYISCCRRYAPKNYDICITRFYMNCTWTKLLNTNSSSSDEHSSTVSKN